MKDRNFCHGQKGEVFTLGSFDREIYFRKQILLYLKIQKSSVPFPHLHSLTSLDVLVSYSIPLSWAFPHLCLQRTFVNIIGSLHLFSASNTGNFKFG